MAGVAARRHPRGGGDRALGPRVAGHALVGRARGGVGPRADGGDQPPGRIGAARQHAGGAAPTRCSPSCRWPPARRRGSPKASCSRGLRRLRLGAVGARRDHAPIAGLDARRPGAAPRRRRAACWTCAPPPEPRPRIWPRSVRGRVLAVERNPRRAEALKDTAARMHAGAVAVRELDAAIVGSPVAPVGLGPRTASTACSSTRRAAAWARCSRGRTSAGTPRRRRSTSSPACRRGFSPRGPGDPPGGALVYSVCTISRAEGEGVVEAFLAAASRVRGRAAGPRTPNTPPPRRVPTCSCVPTVTAPTASSSPGWCARLIGGGAIEPRVTRQAGSGAEGPVTLVG